MSATSYGWLVLAFPLAGMLVIAKKTVEHHRSHILEKLGMRDRVELVRYAIRRGLVEP